MIVIVLKALCFYLASWAAWRLLRQLYTNAALDNIPGPRGGSFWKGVFPQVFNSDGWGFHTELMEKYGSVIKIRALLGENQLYVYDPKALHHIIVKDQSIYEETAGFIEGNKLVFGLGLLGTLGEQHRKQRKMLNPVFSSVHMREMIPIFTSVVSKLRDSLSFNIRSGPQEIDILFWMSRTALELVGQSGLGYSFDPLTEDAAAHPYSQAAKELIPALFPFAFIRVYFLVPLVKLGSPQLRRFIVDLIPWMALRKLRDIVDTLYDTSVEIFEAKKEALEAGDEAVVRQIGQGKDILSILIKANSAADEADRLTRQELIGQMTTMIFAATDTTSTALCRILWILSHRQDVQERLRQEIRNAKTQNNGVDFSYDELVSLPYLDAICRETLRLYPPVPMVTRTTRKDVVLPLSTPIKGVDGTEITEVPIPNNTNVIVSIVAANRNPEIWGPDAAEWKPERWLEPLPDSVTSAHVPGIYSHLMTFLGGSRACIGFKFSQLEMKVVLSLLIDSFQFSPAKEEVRWLMNGIVCPTVVGWSGAPKMPLKVATAP